MLFYQFMHSSESILGVWENFHSIHPLGAYTFFQQNPCVMISESFFKEKLEVISFQKHFGFLVNQFYFLFCFSF